MVSWSWIIQSGHRSVVDWSVGLSVVLGLFIARIVIKSRAKKTESSCKRLDKMATELGKDKFLCPHIYHKAIPIITWPKAIVLAVPLVCLFRRFEAKSLRLCLIFPYL